MLSKIQTYPPLNESLKVIAFKWKLGFKFDDTNKFHQYIDAKELEPFIAVHRKIGDRHSESSWKELEQDLIKNKWDKKRPLLLLLYADEKGAVADGNHRLKIVLDNYDKHESLRMVPVKVHFSETTDK